MSCVQVLEIFKSYIYSIIYCRGSSIPPDPLDPPYPQKDIVHQISQNSLKLQALNIHIEFF